MEGLLVARPELPPGPSSLKEEVTATARTRIRLWLASRPECLGPRLSRGQNPGMQSLPLWYRRLTRRPCLIASTLSAPTGSPATGARLTRQKGMLLLVGCASISWAAWVEGRRTISLVPRRFCGSQSVLGTRCSEPAPFL